MGYNSSWLEYDSGVKVPEYASLFWVDSKQPWTPGYLEDEGRITTSLKTGIDEEQMTFFTGTRYNITETTAKLLADLTGTDSVTINYS